jgi:hypothetical protein
MGLLGNGWDDPQSQAMMALAGGLLQGNFGGGLLGANQAFSQAKQDAAKKQLFDMQLQEHQMKLQDAQRQREFLANLPSPQFMAGANTMANGAGPTVANAARIPAANPMQDMLFQGVRAGAVPLGDYLKTMTPAERINKLDAKDFSPASVQKFNQTGNYADLVRLDKLHFADTGGGIAGLDPFTGQRVGGVNKTGNPFSDLLLTDGQGGMRPNLPLIGAKSQIAKAGASNVNVALKQEGEEAKAVGKFFGENYADVQKSGLSAQSSINRLDRLGQLLEGVDTGKFAPLGVEVAKTAQAAGLNIDPNLSNKEAAIALSSEIALQLRNPFGGAGMPGAMSDADRNFLAGMVPGIEKTPDGRKLILETAKKLAKRDIEVARMAREYRQKNGTINEGFYDRLAQHSESNPLFSGQRSNAPQPAATMRYNAQTGKLEAVK